MQITVRQTGGALGLDRVTEVVDAVARRVDGGEVTAERTLDEAVATRLCELVDRVAAVDEAAAVAAPTAVDAMDVEVAIGTGPEARAFRYSTAGAVPRVVAELVRAVVATPFRDPPG
ncbi:MAG TPA: hypothetical protein VFU19_05720 [Iamia sp.]|nr:hypothetical protein [Iamia sp.]